MALKIPAPLLSWSQAYQIRVNQALEANDLGVRRKGADIEIAPSEKLIMRSPNGARWQITVSNAGVVAAVAL